MEVGAAVGSVPALIMLAAANPYKMECVLELVERHLEHGAKILVFCDHLLLLHEYGKLLQAPVICGTTPHRERLMIFSDFQSTARVNVICISRVGDVSVNLPRANVVLQVSSHGGSRRQEAQRLGRILRPKEPRSGGGAEKTAVEAWFYSIVSVHTLETAHAARRTAFLVDQGYTCRVMEYVPHSQRVSEDESRAPDTASDLHDAPGQPNRAVAKVEKAATLSSSSSSAAAHVKNESTPPRPKETPDTSSPPSPKPPPPPVKTDSAAVVVGDAVSIKAEAMQSELHGSRVLRRRTAPSSAGDGAALPMREAWRRVTSVAYQLHLLSKVVSTWEMTFRQRTASRRHGIDDAVSHSPHDSRGLSSSSRPNHPRNTAGEPSDDDGEVEVLAPRRDWRTIKKEWGGGEDATASSSRYASSGSGARGRGEADGLSRSDARVSAETLSLQQLVGASEDFVYHEL